MTQDDLVDEVGDDAAKGWGQEVLVLERGGEVEGVVA